MSEAQVAGRLREEDGYVSETIAAHTGRGGSFHRFPFSWDAWLVGIFAFALSAIGSNRAYFSYDEATTNFVSSFSLPQLWKHFAVDGGEAFHGLYYLIIHFWRGLVPASELTLRLPSALAIGIAAAGVVVLAKQLSTRAVAVTAGIFFALIPRVTYAGIDARPMAFTMSAAVWLTVFCVSQSRRGQDASWWVYGLLLFFAGVLNGNLMLIIPAHAVAVKATSARLGVSLKGWITAVTVAVICLVPLTFFAGTRYRLADFPFHNASLVIEGVFIQPYFKPDFTSPFSAPVAIFSGVILLVGLAVGLRSRVGRFNGLVVMCVIWIAFPTVVGLLAQVVANHAFRPRHLSFVAPALALLLGLCTVTATRQVLRARWAPLGIAAVLASFAVVAAPAYFAQREPYGRGSIDYAPVANVFESYAADGDCVVVDNSPVPNAIWRLGVHKGLRPAVYERLQEVARRQTTLGIVYRAEYPVGDRVAALIKCPVLWTISVRDGTLPQRQEGDSLPPGPQMAQTDSYKIPSGIGFRIVERWQFEKSQVTKSVRRPDR